MAGRTGRFIVGLLAADRSRLVGFGTVELAFTYLGARGSVNATGPATQPVTAHFLPIPGQRIDATGTGPRFVEGSEGIGIYRGPITDSVSALAKRHGDVMDFVHLEMWKDFEKGELNEAAAAWVSPPGTDDAREPWVFVVGRDGRITHRFDNVASDAELERAVAGLTR